MHPYFHVTKEDIKLLDDTQARELVARLCKAELDSRKIAADKVTWGGNQRSKDGGVDVRVELESGISISGYIPRNSTVYQVKAENFSESKIPGEMAPKGILRPAIGDLAAISGAYIIVSTKDDVSDSYLGNRRSAMAKCLKDHGLDGKVQIDFYDTQKIADWVENFPSIFMWFRTAIGKPIDGWRPYEPWAYQEKSLLDEYFLDDKIKISVPNSYTGIDAIEGINRIRDDLGNNGSSVRIVGLSGVGKTRLVQALFDDRIATINSTLDPNKVIYTDLSYDPTPHPISMLNSLVSTGSDCVVVVDNCGQDVHQTLTNIVKKANSKIRLVTVEYDIRDNSPDKTVCYKLEGSSGQVISKLLNRHFPSLSGLDIEKITEFSDGNARVAFALASTSENRGELARLQDDELFRRLFLQKHSENSDLQSCAEAASLVYSFDIEDREDDSEMAILADIAGVSLRAFYRNVKELEMRGLIQARGKWRAVLPHAIANRLALLGVEFNQMSLLVQKFVIDSPERISRSFSRRLGYLHESLCVQELVEDWLKVGGILGDVSKLTGLKWEMFENVSPVCQHSALNAMLIGIENPYFTSLDNPDRSSAVRLLRSLAYEADMFNNAVNGLLSFVVTEPERYAADSESAPKIIESLFYAVRSGTLAPPLQRAALLKELAFSQNAKISKLALLLLRASLESGNFPYQYSFDFGALKRGNGWCPLTKSDIKNWYFPFIRIAVDLGCSATSSRLEARSILASAFRKLWVDLGLFDELSDAAIDLSVAGECHEIWIAVRQIAYFDNQKINQESFDRLQELEKRISPKDLGTRIKANILSSGPFAVDIEDLELDSTSNWETLMQEECHALGKAAALDEDLLISLITSTINCDTTKISHFGFGVGLASLSASRVLTRLKTLLCAKDDGIRNCLQFICGLIKGWNRTGPEEVIVFLDQAVKDPIWGPIFPTLEFSIEIEALNYARLSMSLKLGLAPSCEYLGFGYQRRTDCFTVMQISSLISQLAEKSDGGLSVAINVLHTVIYRSTGKDNEYKICLHEFCVHFVTEIDWTRIDISDENSLSYLVKLLEFTLDRCDSHQSVSKIFRRMIQHEGSIKRKFPHRLVSILLPFFRKEPIQTLDILYESVESSALLRMFTSRRDRYGKSPLDYVDEHLLLDWCKVSPADRCIFVARTCEILENSDQEGRGKEVVVNISSTVINLVAMAIDKRALLEALVSRFRPTARTGSIAAIRDSRIKCFDQLNLASGGELSSYIEGLKQDFLESIEFDVQLEAKMQQRNATSFES